MEILKKWAPPRQVTLKCPQEVDPLVFDRWSSNVLHPRALVPWMCSTSLLTILWKNFFWNKAIAQTNLKKLIVQAIAQANLTKVIVQAIAQSK